MKQKEWAFYVWISNIAAYFKIDENHKQTKFELSKSIDFKRLLKYLYSLYLHEMYKSWVL